MKPVKKKTGRKFKNSFPKRKSGMKRAPVQPKITILWGSKAVYEKLSFELFWAIFKGKK